MPGIERIELTCNRLFGSGITAEGVRRLRARLCDDHGMSLPDADKIGLHAVADLIESSPPAAAPRAWTPPREWGDPSRCPGCGTPVPEALRESAPHVTCQQCRGYTLHTNVIMVPVAKPGAAPVRLQTAASYWAPCHSPLTAAAPPGGPAAAAGGAGVPPTAAAAAAGASADAPPTRTTSVPPADGADGAEASDKPDWQALLVAVADESTLAVITVARDCSKSADERMRTIYTLDNRALGWKSPKWASVLGVKDAAVRQTAWWKEDRPRLIGRD
jgi:hypothetical protein